MNTFRKIISGLLALCLLLLSPAPALAASDTTIIRQLLNYYRYYQSAANTDIDRLLGDLREQSPEKARRWQTILDDWRWVNGELDLRSGVLPDGLPEDDSLCIVVLGYQLTPTGKMSSELVGRMEVALDAAQKYPNAYILLTGGVTGSSNKSATEAGRMASWLIANGIAESRVIRETQAYSTETNAINCLKLLRKNYPQVKHLALITSDYHMAYSYMLFSARQQLQYGGELDMVGAACYDTNRSSSYSYEFQASAIAAIAGVNVDKMRRPTLSRVTTLAVLGDTVYAPGEALDLTATAVYDSGVFQEITDKAVFSGYDGHSLGMQTLTVSYTENGNTVTTELDILVQEEAAYVPLPSEEIPTDVWVTEAVDEPEEATPEEEKTEGFSFLWLLVLIPVVLTGYELHERHQRIQRRRRRRRRKIRWE